MQFINSSIGVDDEVIINDINYSAISGPSFTPGIGGTYKESPPPFKPPTDEPAQWQNEEPDQGCEHTLTAGWRTHSYCTPKTVTCDLERPYEPQRHIEPGRLQYLAACKKAQEKKVKTKELDIKEIVMYVAIAYMLYILYVKFLRL
jgi:hypothetical protein